MTNANPFKLYTVKEVAEILKVHPQTIYDHLYEGRLTGTKATGSWRISEQDLLDYLEGGRKKTPL